MTDIPSPKKKQGKGATENIVTSQPVTEIKKTIWVFQAYHGEGILTSG